MGTKPKLLGVLAQAAGLAVLGTVQGQTPPPNGVRLPAPQYGLNSNAPAGSRPSVPPMAPSYTRPYTDWTPTPPPPGYVPPIPPVAGSVRHASPVSPPPFPAGAGLGAGVASSPAPKPGYLQRAITDGSLRPAGGAELPPPNFDFSAVRPVEASSIPGGLPLPQTVTPQGSPTAEPAYAGQPAINSHQPTLPTPLPLPSIPSSPSTSHMPRDVVATQPHPLAMPEKSLTPSIAVPGASHNSNPNSVSGISSSQETHPNAEDFLKKFPTTGDPQKSINSPFSTHPSMEQANNTQTGPGSAFAPSLPSRLAPCVIVEAFAPETVNFGQEFKYDLVVRNTGSVAVHDVKVFDEVPSGSRFLSSDPPAEVSGEHLTWSLGVVEPGADRRIVVRIKPADEGEIRSRATVSFSTAVDARTRVTRPRVNVVVTGPETAKVGEETAFIIKVTNTGSGPATKLLLKALLTEGLICPKVPATGGQEIETVLADVKPGETKSIKLPIAASRAGMQSCQILAMAEGSPDSSARVSVNVVEALLQMKQSGPGQCLVRSEPTYTIDLANPGTASTDALAVHSALPDGFEFVQASDGGIYNHTTRTVAWRLPPLPAGGARQVTLKLRSVAACDSVLRTIAQSGGEGTISTGGVTPVAATGTRVLEARAETPVRSEGVPAIRFDVHGVDGLVEVGKEALYEIRVTNQGTGPCSNVQLLATLADGLNYAGANGPTQVRTQGQQLLFDPIPTLGVKGEAVYRVRLRGTVPGDLRLRVQLSCDQVATPVVKEESTRFYQQ